MYVMLTYVGHFRSATRFRTPVDLRAFFEFVAAGRRYRVDSGRFGDFEDAGAAGAPVEARLHAGTSVVRALPLTGNFFDEAVVLPRRPA